MNRLIPFILITILFTSVSSLKSQGDFSPILKFKKTGDNECRMRIIPKDYFESKAIGLSGIKIEITPFATDGKVLNNVNKRTLALDTFTRSEWKSFKMTPQLAAVAQQLFAKPKLYGASTAEQLTNAKKVQENTYLTYFMATAFSWDAAEKARTGVTLELSDDTAYVIKASLLHSSPYVENDTNFVSATYISENLNTERPFIDAEGREKAVRLYWPKDKDLIAYHIQESDLNGENLKFITNKPYVNATVDSVSNDIYYDIPVEKNYVVKRYRIAGFDVFGDSTIYSDWINSYGQDRTPPQRIQEVETSSRGEYQVTLKWTNPLDGDRDRIDILYGSNENKPTEKLATLNANENTWTHTSASNIKNNYYWVVAIDTAGNTEIPFSRKVITFDSVAPAPPKIIRAEIDTSGLIEILWNKSNIEDIRGYKIGMSSSPNEVPINLTNEPQVDTSYLEKIPLRAVKGTYYYFVRSQDLKGNIGDYSEPLKITLPDKIPPAFPMITAIQPTNQGNLQISLNLPKDEDATSMRYKRITDQRDTSDWIMHALQSQIMDSTVSHKHRYSYIIQTIDDAGNHSISQVTASKKPFPKIINISKAKIQLNRIKETADGSIYNINWNGLPANTEKIRLFKKEGDSPYYEIGKFAPSLKQIKTKALMNYTVHRWAIRIVDAEGNNSNFLESDILYVKPLK